MIINKARILRVNGSLEFHLDDSYIKTENGFTIKSNSVYIKDYYLSPSDKYTKVINDNVFVKPYIDIELGGKTILRRYFDETDEAQYTYSTLLSKLNNGDNFMELSGDWN